MSAAARSYIPAAGRDWLLPFYDPLWRLIGGKRFHEELMHAAALEPGMRALDVGCGTGSLVTVLAAEHPGVVVTGLDPDPLALGRARKKIERAGLDVTLDRGFADRLPYGDASFERVFSSFMFHHLDREVKQGMLREVRRVLAPGGAFHLLDFGGETHRHGVFERFIHSADDLHDNFGGTIPALIREAGFTEAHEVASNGTLFGRVTHYAAH